MKRTERNMLMRIGKKLARCRRRAGITQSEVAKALQLSRSSVSRIERGKRDSGVDELFIFANACGAKLTITFTLM